MRVVFWQDILSLHQSAHIRALAARREFEVVLAAEAQIQAERLEIGWMVPDFGQARTLVAPDRAHVRRLIHERPQQSVHIFTGTRYSAFVQSALRESLSTASRIGIQSESGDCSDWKYPLRYLVYMAEARYYRRRVDFVLAMGSMGEDWFLKTGYPRDKVYPYGYFVEQPPLQAGPRSPRDTAVKLVYIGQLIRRKGVDLLLKALAQVGHPDWDLKIIGAGPEQASLQTLARRLGLESRVAFLGVRANQEVASLLVNADCLVLPSRWDGWGAVVNEALMQGTPVICSTRCGAADLVGGPDRGEVFEAESVASLTAALDRVLARGPVTPERRVAVKEWARCVTGDAAADYLTDVIHHVLGRGGRPLACWLRS
jgi:glycosyltransferase involved in cell wall biosynthesis